MKKNEKKFPILEETVLMISLFLLMVAGAISIKLGSYLSGFALISFPSCFILLKNVK